MARTRLVIAPEGMPPTGIAGLTERLRAAGCVFAEDEAALLMAEAASAGHLEQMVTRRIAGEPLEQIVGWAEFAGLRLAVTPGVFVPRQRTLLLAREAVALTPPVGHLLDLCCGVGAVAAVAAHDRPDVTIHLSDIDPFAVDCARRNVPTARTHTGDLFDALPRDLRFDVIAVNAPYVPTEQIADMPPEARDHERHVALDGGPDGLAFHRRIAVSAMDRLTPGGHVLIETARHLAPMTAGALIAHGLGSRTVHDDDLAATVVIGSPSAGSTRVT